MMSVSRDFNALAEHCGSKLKVFAKIMFYVALFFRISHFLYKIKLVPFSRLFWLLNRVLFSIDIDPRAVIKGGLVILHGAGIVIGKSVIINGNVKIYQGVTLGGNNGKKRKVGGSFFSQPIIEENVVIGINAVVLGPVILEKKVNIGANAIVTKDVPANSTVVSNNKILNKNNL
ncbi:serine O-acetyltransferase [Zunongwangia pacifica]|uniref:Serine acetyltransferase n=1 Tax=Zunongwangia pacifica TaxID=2911062 RepID=A0A9X1ZMW4_9FLAO|nr:DapH/DapD/GlmU-related protein [Zunongwangia pacifica]MCL6216759.1 hypothetical protein [Zunongwangia pacifica]